MADYNSYPWSYEVLRIAKNGDRVGISFENEVVAKALYWDIQDCGDTVLLTKSRLGVVKGTPGL